MNLDKKSVCRVIFKKNIFPFYFSSNFTNKLGIFGLVHPSPKYKHFGAPDDGALIGIGQMETPHPDIPQSLSTRSKRLTHTTQTQKTTDNSVKKVKPFPVFSNPVDRPNQGARYVITVIFDIASCKKPFLLLYNLQSASYDIEDFT